MAIKSDVLIVLNRMEGPRTDHPDNKVVITLLKLLGVTVTDDDEYGIFSKEYGEISTNPKWDAFARNLDDMAYTYIVDDGHTLGSFVGKYQVKSVVDLHARATAGLIAGDERDPVPGARHQASNGRQLCGPVQQETPTGYPSGYLHVPTPPTQRRPYTGGYGG
jgi:hypothetical protein